MKFLQLSQSYSFSFVSSIESQFPHIIGYIYCLLANLCSSFRNMFVRKAHDVPHFQLFYLRVLSLTIILYFIHKCQKQPMITKSSRINAMLIFIGVMSLLSGSSNFYGFQMIPLNEASVIFQTQPAIQSVLAALFLKEVYDFTQFLSTLFCTIGVLLVVKPDFIFGGGLAPLEDESNRIKGTVSLLFSAVVAGFQSITIKKTVAHVSSNLSVFYIGMIPAVLGSFLILTEGIKEMTYDEWVMMTGIILLGFLAQILYNRGYTFGDAGKIAVMGYSQIIFGYILDIWLLGTVPDFYSIIGSVFIFCCMFLRIYQTWKNTKRKTGT